MLPNQAVEHSALLTLNSHELPMYKDALPGVPGVDAQPLFLDPHQGIWVLRAVFHPGVVLPRHYHTGTVHLFTLSGSWQYAEYPEQPQTAGSYLYEPGGSIHQFTVPADASEPAVAVMVVHGANVNFDDDGNYLGIMDASDIMHMFDTLVAERGMEPAQYIRPAPAAYSRGGA